MNRNNYRHAQACGNCKHVFRIQEIDDPGAWYCTCGAPMRPSCDSREEMPEATWELLNAWHDWAKANEVCAWWICDRYEADEFDFLGMKVAIDPSLQPNEIRLAKPNI